MDKPEQSLPTPAVQQLSLTRKFSSPLNSSAEELSRPGKRPRLDLPPPMTAAAAVAEARPVSKSPLDQTIPSTKISPNPATEALSALMGVSQNAISKAYMPTTQSPVTPATSVIERQTNAGEHAQANSSDGTANASDSHVHTSPTSASSFGAPDSIAAPSGMETTVASPQPMETNIQSHAASGSSDVNSAEDGPKAFSYPAPLLQPNLSDGRRGMSLPHSGLRHNTRSPSSKKHQCPFCKTEFTRHHNLKSHLLTHSQEKPYVCTTCQSKFRRLHDLKRHSKLHTGERPHVCPKCNRKFARGDALARHNKGPGGCAGRRASMGSFAGDDDMDGNDDSMEGVMYNEPEAMEDVDETPVKGTPTIRRQAPSGDDNTDEPDPYGSRMPSTYPPIQGRPPGGIASGTFPPRTNYGPAPPTAPAVSVSSHGPPLYSSAGSGSSLRPSNTSSIFAQNPLTESPKPMATQRGSGPVDSRMHSPSMTHYQPPPTFSRSQSTSGPGHGPPTNGPQLPPPHVLNPPDSRFTLASQGAPTHPPTQPSGPPTHMSGSGPLSSHSNSLSSHGASGPGPGEINSMFNKDDRIWAYVKTLESRMETMQEEINGLKQQLAVSLGSQPIRTQP